MLKVFVTAVVISVIVPLTTSSDSSQPQTSSTPEVRKRLIDYLTSRTVVNQSNATDNNCLPESGTGPLLHASTPKQQTLSSTDTVTPTIGTESKTSKRVENALLTAFRIKTPSPIKAVTSPTDKRRRNLLHPFGTNKIGTIEHSGMQNKGTAHCTQKGHQTRGKAIFCIFSFEEEKGKPAQQNADRHVGFLSC